MSWIENRIEFGQLLERAITVIGYGLNRDDYGAANQGRRLGQFKEFEATMLRLLPPDTYTEHTLRNEMRLIRQGKQDEPPSDLLVKTIIDALRRGPFWRDLTTEESQFLLDRHDDGGERKYSYARVNATQDMERIVEQLCDLCGYEPHVEQDEFDVDAWLREAIADELAQDTNVEASTHTADVADNTLTQQSAAQDALRYTLTDAISALRAYIFHVFLRKKPQMLPQSIKRV